MKDFLLPLILVCLLSCSDEQRLSINVTNPLPMNRSKEMVELSSKEIINRLGLSDTAQVIVLDEQGEQVPYQITYDDRLIFPACVEASSTATYTICQGVPMEVPVTTKGRLYPERLDDVAWENDHIGCRAYGPALQQSGQHGYGYDIFLKRGTTEPVLDELYHNDIVKKISYHVDHGKGMDCYAVGPTLGAGVSALMLGDTILYPWCYKDFEILDNGPLRFTVRLTFHPKSVGNDSCVVESRLISLDEGSQLNRTVITYAGLTQTLPIVSGIVLHDSDGRVSTCADKGYITYIDPTQGPDNGLAMMGCAFPDTPKEAKVVLFSPEEKAVRAGADGHVLAISSYEPNTEYAYYWGFAWDRAGVITTPEEWDNYMGEYVQRLRHPLELDMK